MLDSNNKIQLLNYHKYNMLHRNLGPDVREINTSGCIPPVSSRLLRKIDQQFVKQFKDKLVKDPTGIGTYVNTKVSNWYYII